MAAFARRRIRIGSGETRTARAVFAGALGACALALAANLVLSELRPGSTFGQAYGVVAVVLMLAAALFGLRRRSMRWSTRFGLGTARAWLRVHLYGGVLFLVLVGLHTGFRLPEGGLGWLLWGLSVWTVATGVLGLALQQWLPRALGSGLATEVHYDRIPVLVGDLRERAEALAEAAESEPVRRLHARRVVPALERPRRRLRYFIDPTGSIHDLLREFDYVVGLMSGPERERADALRTVYRTKLEIDAHYTLQRALRLWLVLHVPVSVVLVAVVAVHVATSLYY